MSGATSSPSKPEGPLSRNFSRRNSTSLKKKRGARIYNLYLQVVQVLKERTPEVSQVCPYTSQASETVGPPRIRLPAGSSGAVPEVSLEAGAQDLSVPEPSAPVGAPGSLRLSRRCTRNLLKNENECSMPVRRFHLEPCDTPGDPRRALTEVAFPIRGLSLLVVVLT